MLIAAQAEIITAHVTVEIVIEGALLTVFEQNTHEAGATDKNRGHFFDDNSTAPLSVIGMDYVVSEPEIKAFLVHLRSSAVCV
jgi:hypothetical protein